MHQDADCRVSLCLKAVSASMKIDSILRFLGAEYYSQRSSPYWQHQNPLDEFLNFVGSQDNNLKKVVYGVD